MAAGPAAAAAKERAPRDASMRRAAGGEVAGFAGAACGVGGVGGGGGGGWGGRPRLGFGVRQRASGKDEDRWVARARAGTPGAPAGLGGGLGEATLRYCDAAFGVFDGHGGTKAASACEELLLERLEELAARALEREREAQGGSDDDGNDQGAFSNAFKVSEKGALSAEGAPGAGADAEAGSRAERQKLWPPGVGQRRPGCPCRARLACAARQRQLWACSGWELRTQRRLIPPLRFVLTDTSLLQRAVTGCFETIDASLRGVIIDGTTATMLFLKYDLEAGKVHGLCAWVGDSRAALLLAEREPVAAGGKPAFSVQMRSLSKDHKPSCKIEQDRIASYYESVHGRNYHDMLDESVHGGVRSGRMRLGNDGLPTLKVSRRKSSGALVDPDSQYGGDSWHAGNMARMALENVRKESDVSVHSINSDNGDSSGTATPLDLSVHGHDSPVLAALDEMAGTQNVRKNSMSRLSEVDSHALGVPTPPDISARASKRRVRAGLPSVSFIARLDDGYGQSRPRLIRPDGSSMGVSRSIGSAGGARAVIASPEFSEFSMANGDVARVMLASDGLWDVYSSEDALATSTDKHTAVGAADAMAARALNRRHMRGQGQDDITVLVVDIDTDGSALQPALRAARAGAGAGCSCAIQ